MGSNRKQIRKLKRRVDALERQDALPRWVDDSAPLSPITIWRDVSAD